MEQDHKCPKCGTELGKEADNFLGAKIITTDELKFIVDYHPRMKVCLTICEMPEPVTRAITISTEKLKDWLDGKVELK